MNFALITTLSLVFANPLNFGMAIAGGVGYESGFDEPVLTQTSDVGMQDSNGYIYLPNGGVVPASGGGVYIPGDTDALEDAIAIAGFYEGFLDQDADVTISVADEPREPGFNSGIDPFGEATIVSPKATVTLPYSALSPSNEQTNYVEFNLYVKHDGEFEELSTPEGQALNIYQYDIRIRFDDGTEYVTAAPYYPLTPALLYLGEIYGVSGGILEGKTSETVTITFQVVNIDLTTAGSNSALTTQGLGYPVPRGLHQVTDSYKPEDGNAACIFPGNGERIREEFMPPTLKDVSESGLSAIEDKTPLVLIHGRQLAEEVARVAFNIDVAGRSTFV